MNGKHDQVLPLPRADHPVLARAIGDTPISAISLHLLLRGLGKAYVAGNPAHFEAAVVQSTLYPLEPVGFGANAPAMWTLLRAMSDWDCVSVSLDCAPALGNLIESETGRRVRYYGDVYHALTTPAATFQHDAVRLLTPADLPLLAAAPEEVRGAGWASALDLLEQGIVAGAVVDGQVVAIAFTSTRTPRHADIGVHTLAPWRRQGLATAAASLVAQQVQAAGQIPVWSTGEDNWASLRVAQKLGFAEVARLTYVIPERSGTRATESGA